jgi:hypothetical protein
VGYNSTSADLPHSKEPTVHAHSRDFRFGRVEDGRGSLGPMANAPFPIPARQTGRADFRHPAFRLASPRDTRRGRSGQTLEAQNAEFSMNYIECESAIAAPLQLVPSREEPAHTFKDVLVDATVCLAPPSRSQSSWTSLAETCSACHILRAMDRCCWAPEDRRSWS